MEHREYTPIEKLAIGTALKQKLDEVIGTKNASNVRGQADAELIERYERTGEAAMDVMLNSGKVGTFTVMLTAPKPEKRKRVLEVTDRVAFESWAIDNGFWRIDREAIDKRFAECGEIPDGCDVRLEVTPGDAGGAVKGTRFTVKSDDVIDALGGYLEPGMAGLLDEAIEEEW